MRFDEAGGDERLCASVRPRRRIDFRGRRAPQDLRNRLVSKARNPIDAHVGARVRLRRMALGVSQEKLGEWLGLTFQQIQKYEKGANRIGASRLFAISQRLGVPVQYFFEGLSEAQLSEDGRSAPGGDGLTDLLSSAEGFQLNAAFSRIEDAETRKKIVELVKTLSAAPAARESVA